MVSMRGGRGLQKEGQGCERGFFGGDVVQFALSGRRLQCQDLFLKLSLDARVFRREVGVTERSAGLRA